MKFDPVCWKKNHEKGRIQFVCIERDCKAERRLACAHCIIEEHDEHVSNKITLEQYCETFDSNFKWYLFQVAKLEEGYNKCKMAEIIDLIDKDINILVENIKQQLRALRELYVSDILNFAETNNTTLISLYNDERQRLSKMKEYSNKNLFEMTPAEMDHSMLMMGAQHIDSISNQLANFQDQTTNVSTTVKQQWKLINEQLTEGIKDVVSQIGMQNFNFTSSGKDTPIDQVAILLQDQLDQNGNQGLPNYLNIQLGQQDLQSQYIKQTLPQQRDYSSQQLFSNQQSNSPKTSVENQNFKQVSGISSCQMTSPLKNGKATAQFGSNFAAPNQKSLKNLMQFNSNFSSHQKSIQKAQTQTRQVSPTGKNYYYQSDGKAIQETRKPTNHMQSLSSSSQHQLSFDKRLSAQKIQAQFTCNHNNMKCSHNELLKAHPIFSCCNWAYPCYECHDMVSTHKAHITVPSQRYCPHCAEIFTVNLMSTVDVKCYKCQ